MAKSEPPARTERGAQIIGQLLKAWPPKEAPVLVQIAFCEELKRAAEAYQSDPQHGWWFFELTQAVERSITNLKRLNNNIKREADSVKDRLDGTARGAPSELFRAVNEAVPGEEL